MNSKLDKYRKKSSGGIFFFHSDEECLQNDKDNYNFIINASTLRNPDFVQITFSEYINTCVNGN